MAMLIMSVTSLMTKYSDNPVEHKISTLQCLFSPCLADINHQLTNIFTLREGFVLVFQEYGSRVQTYSLAYNRRGKNCGLYKVTLKRSLNGLCSHSATCLCSRQALRVRHACICRFVFVFACICKFVFVNLHLYLPEFVNDELGQIQAMTGCTRQHSWATSKPINVFEKIFALQNLDLRSTFLEDV